jgi:hypothetical protein
MGVVESLAGAIEILERSPVSQPTLLLSISLERDLILDSFVDLDGKKLRTIFGHADCRFTAVLHAEYDQNQFVNIDIDTDTHGIQPKAFSCRGTVGEKRYLTGGPLIVIKEIHRSERRNEIVVEITQQ